jgi:ammonia channel protein AmtB
MVLVGLTIIFTLIGFVMHGGACIMGIVAGICGLLFIISLGEDE